MINSMRPFTKGDEAASYREVDEYQRKGLPDPGDDDQHLHQMARLPWYA
jgi:hypothetical protein